MEASDPRPVRFFSRTDTPDGRTELAVKFHCRDCKGFVEAESCFPTDEADPEHEQAFREREYCILCACTPEGTKR